MDNASGVKTTMFNPSNSELLLNDGHPIVTETVFKAHILDILTRLYEPDSMTAYRRFVPHLTHPLKVVSDTDAGEVLFTVPALAPAPNPSIADANRGITASAFIDYANEQQERGVSKNALLKQFFDRTIRIPDPYQAVIKPILEILDRYGRTMFIQTENGPMELSWKALQGQQPTATAHSPVTDDPYSDQMVF